MNNIKEILKTADKLNSSPLRKLVKEYNEKRLNKQPVKKTLNRIKDLIDKILYTNK